MRYNTIRQLDIANGPGCRVSLFVQGCPFNCPGCFNGVARDFSGGKEFTDQTVELILELLKPGHIKGLSILGGEPFAPQNRGEVLELTKKVKQEYPDKNIWVWTGYEWEDVRESLSDSGIDVLVDGKFVQDLRDPRLQYRGSTNQRVIDVLKSSSENRPISII